MNQKHFFMQLVTYLSLGVTFPLIIFVLVFRCESCVKALLILGLVNAFWASYLFLIFIKTQRTQSKD